MIHGGPGRRWAWFVAGIAAGAGLAVSLLGALTIGIFVLPFPVALTVLLAVRHPEGLIGAISGLGLPPLFVAYLNRDGPGTVCTSVAGGTSCTDEWAPLPWAVAGLVLVAVGIVVFGMVARPRARAVLSPDP